MATDPAPNKFVAGHYTATLSQTAGVGSSSGATVDLGTTETGFNIQFDQHIEQIRIDDLGQTVVDGIYQGMNARITFKSIQFAAAGRLYLQAFYNEATPGTITGIGQSISGVYGRQLVLTPIAGINAGNKTYTFPVVAPDGNNGAMALNTKNRTIDVNFLAFPQLTGSGSSLTAVLYTED